MNSPASGFLYRRDVNALQVMDALRSVRNIPRIISMELILTSHLGICSSYETLLDTLH